jgi:hypothetical protein
MERWKLIAAAGIVTVVLGAYFSGGPRVPMDNDTTSSLAQSQASKSPKPEELVGKWNEANELSDGIFLTVTEPVQFKAKDPASLGVEGRPQLFDVTVANKGQKPFDLSSFVVLETTLKSDPATSCSDVFEMDSGVSGIPLDPVVKPNGSTSFKWAISCPGPLGDSLAITFGLSDTQHLKFESTLK